MDILHNFKQYFSFTKKEAFALLVTSLVFGFMFSFREWGAETLDFRTGIFSWLNASLVAVLAVLLRIVVQKIVAIYRGYKVEYKLWSTGLVIGILIVFLSNGLYLAAIPGIITITMMEQFRLGKRYQGKLRKDEALIGFIGPLSSILLALVFQGLLSAGFTNQLIQKVITMNIWIAAVTILPIPYFDGFKVFYHSRTLGLFSMLFIITMAVFLSRFSFWQTIITALVFAALFSIVYFIKFEL